MKKAQLILLSLLFASFSLIADDKAQFYTIQDQDVTIIDGVIYSCELESGIRRIIIPDYLQGQQVIGIADAPNSSAYGVFANKDLWSVKFPPTLEFIGDNSFYYNDIFILDFSDLTSLKRIGNDAFRINNVDSIYFDNCTSLERIGDNAFWQNQLRLLDLTDCSNLYTIGDLAFSSNLLGNSDLILNNCHQLTYIGKNAFSSNFIDNFVLPACEGYESLGWKNIDGNTYPTYSHASNLETCYYVPHTYTLEPNDIVVENGTIIECNYDFKFKQIVIPKEVDGETITAIAEGESIYDGVFMDKNIVSVQFPESMKTIGNNAFRSNSIINLEFPENNAIEDIGYHSFAYNILRSIDFSNCTNLVNIDSYAFLRHTIQNLNLNSCKKLVNIGEGAFQCSTYPINYFTNINFSECDKLTTIGKYAFLSHLEDNIDMAGCSSLMYIGNSAFYGDNLSSFVLPVNENYNEYGWKDQLGHLFEGGDLVEEIGNFYYVPVFYTLQDSDVVIEDGEIKSCRNDIASKQILIPETIQGQTVRSIADGDTELDGVFARRSLVRILMPKTLEYIGNTAFANNSFIGLYFTNMSKLKAIGKRAFFYMWNVDELDFTDCTDLEYIDEEAFFGNYFESVNLDSCKNLHYIGYWAFCENGPDSFNLPVYQNNPDIGWFDERGNFYEGGESTQRTCGMFYVPLRYTLQDNDVSINNGIITNVNELTGYFNIHIPDTLQDQSVLGISDPYMYAHGIFEDRNLRTVELPQTIRYIGERSFYKNLMDSISLEDCGSLHTISINSFNENLLDNLTLPQPNFAGFENWEDIYGANYLSGEQVSNLYSGFYANGQTSIVTFSVVDQYNNPLDNASVYFGGKLSFTNEDGVVVFQRVFTDTYTYLVTNSPNESKSGLLNIASDTLVEIVFENVGNWDLEHEDVHVFPNPANDAINIFNAHLFQEVTFYNVLGESMLQIDLAKQNRIDISSLSKGIYILKFSQSDGKVITTKILKN